MNARARETSTVVIAALLGRGRGGYKCTPTHNKWRRKGERVARHVNSSHL